MTSLKELREEVKEARAQSHRDNEEANLKKELFELRHKKKIAFAHKVGGGLTHMGKNAVAMAKSATQEKPQAKRKEKKKKKKKYDPFSNVNFGAFR